MILVLLDELEVQYVTHGGIIWLPMALLVIGGVIVIVWDVLARRAPVRPPAMKAPAYALIPAMVPFYFQLFFLTMLFVAGIATRLPILVAISLAMLAISLALHALMQQRLRRARATSSSSHKVLPNV